MEMTSFLTHTLYCSRHRRHFFLLLIYIVHGVQLNNAAEGRGEHLASDNYEQLLGSATDT